MVTQTAEISFEVVGHAFVAEFYPLLHTTPEIAYRFFNDQSTMTRPGPTGDRSTVTTMKEINDLILSLDCTSYKAEILTADTQASHMGGVTVLVVGYLTGQDNIQKKFTESFFLAPQEVGYFVHNDTFVFINEDSPIVATSVLENCDELELAAMTTPMTAVTPIQETAQDTDTSLENHTTSSKEVLETATEPVVQQTPTLIEKALSQTIVNSNLDVQPVVESPSNGVKGAPKMTYASLLMNGRQGSKTLPVRKPATPAKPVKPKLASTSVPPSGPQTHATTVPKPAQTSVPPSGKQTQSATVPTTAATESTTVNQSASNNGNARNKGHVAGKGHSIYIGHLPYDATAELVDREFKTFGSIRKNGIQVRSNNGNVYGFVEFEDASSQEKAIQMGTILIGGKEVFIEEKKTAPRVDGVRSGRGGYHNDGYRRPNNSNGRGYVKNDDGNRQNWEVHPRGIHNGDRHVHQNGRGRGSTKGAPPSRISEWVDQEFL